MVKAVEISPALSRQLELDRWRVLHAGHGAPVRLCQSLFDSSPIKHVEIECPAGMKVVGVGGQVSTSDGSAPLPTVGDIPPASVVFRGVEVDPDLTVVLVG